MPINLEKKLYFHDVISSMSYALDLTEGQPTGLINPLIFK